MILWLVIGVLVGALILSVWVGAVALGSARVTHLVNLAETERRQDAERLLQAERDYSVALESYLPGQPNEGMYVPTGGA
jgi:hypothetical protein